MAVFWLISENSHSNPKRLIRRCVSIAPMTDLRIIIPLKIGSSDKPHKFLSDEPNFFVDFSHEDSHFLMFIPLSFPLVNAH